MSDTKTYPLSAIMGEEITDKERIAELADAFNKVCDENADFVAESIKADRRIAELEAEVKEYAALLRQTTEGTDALAKRQEAEERHLLDRTEQVLQLDHTEQIWGLCRTYERLWKTSVAQTKEECAVIAETASDFLQNSTFDGVAAAIRALKEEEK